MLLSIITDPNKILHQKSAPINPADLASAKMKKLINNMIETMYAADGVGLAAPQVNESIQICVIAKEYSALSSKQGRASLSPSFQEGAQGGVADEDLVLVNPVWEK